MDKTININISGTLFQIDEEAYRVLRDYLHAINNRFRNVAGGAETVEDIESRIAEIFQSERGVAGTVTLNNVETMMSIIGKPEDFDFEEAEQENRSNNSERKRMFRNPDDTIISGVCGGIGAYLNTDPVLFRILFVLFTVTFGVGIFLYIALWIALPPANTNLRKRQMYGSSYASVVAYKRNSDGSYLAGAPSYNKGYYNTSRIGNALNEIFRAVGRVLYIGLRIVLILVGIALVLAASLTILGFVMLLVFKYPVSISNGAVDMNLIYLTDFLNYIVNPVLVPWIIALSLIILIIPMIALIYWGVKMIFWFRAKDGILSLVGFVVWVMMTAILAVILFNEGISMAETARSSTQKIFSRTPKTLYIKTGNKTADLKFDKKINFRDDGYNVMINDERKELYIRPYLKIHDSESNIARVELRKRSSGRNEMDALKKTEDLAYNFSISRDTLFLDEYFTIPSGRKWSADNVGINIYLPVGSVIIFDQPSLKLLHSFISREYYDASGGELKDQCADKWIFTREGLEPADGLNLKKK